MLVPQPISAKECQYTIHSSDIRNISPLHHYVNCRILFRPDLRDLSEIRFTDCDFTGTCLDPNNVPNGEWPGEPGIGFRTSHVRFMGINFRYEVGETYEAPIFSTSNRDCHPGLYIEPNINLLPANCGLIKVKFDIAHVTCSNSFRVKKFTVLEEYKC